MSSTQTTTTNSNVEVPSSVTASTSRGYALTERGAHNITLGGDIPYPIPTFEDKEEERKHIREHLAGAFRVFARKGYTEGSAGHISVRDPIDRNTFWINPLGKHFGLLTAADMIRVDEEGNIVEGAKGASVNAAGFAIHSALHKSRPDVNAACHTHSPYGKTYSCFGKPLEMLNQDVCIFHNNHTVYDDFGGVAVEAAEGENIAKAAGETQAVILQNHGLLTAGYTVDEAAYLFTLMERSCEVQLAADAASAGGFEKKIIGDEEAAYTQHINGDRESLYMEFQPDLEYEIYKDDSFLSYSRGTHKVVNV